MVSTAASQKIWGLGAGFHQIFKLENYEGNLLSFQYECHVMMHWVKPNSSQWQFGMSWCYSGRLRFKLKTNQVFRICSGVWKVWIFFTIIFFVWILFLFCTCCSKSVSGGPESRDLTYSIFHQDHFVNGLDWYISSWAYFFFLGGGHKRKDCLEAEHPTMWWYKHFQRYKRNQTISSHDFCFGYIGNKANMCWPGKWTEIIAIAKPFKQTDQKCWATSAFIFPWIVENQESKGVQGCWK